MTGTMVLFALGLLPGAVESLSLTTSEWPEPLRAETLVQNKPLGDFIRALDRPDAGVLRIRHAGGDLDSRFAEQLRDALVALGVPAARMRLIPAAADASHLVLEITAKGESGL